MQLKSTLIAFSIAASGAIHAQSAKDILTLANKTARALKSVEYTVDANYRDTKIKANFIEQAANVPDAGYASGKYRVKGTAEHEGNLDFFDFAYDGRAMRINNNGKIMVLEDPTPYQAGQHTPFAAVFARIPIMGDIYAEILKGDAKLQLLKPKKIGKWTCDVIEITQKVSHPVMGDKTLVSAVAIDRASHIVIQKSSDIVNVTVTKLALNPPIDEDVFKLAIKETKANSLGPGTDELLALGSKAPNFTLKDAKGKSRSLKDYKGKVLVLDFWATWCLPCRKTMPILQKLSKQGVAVLGVSVDQDYDPVAYMKRQGYSYPIGLGGGATAKIYKAQLLPTLYVIDGEGIIRFRQAGTQPDDAANLPKQVKAASKK